MTNIKNQCSKCGVCCTKGGPALHTEDLALLSEGTLTRENLITIRKGELVFKPFSETPQAAHCELVKICGIGRDWQCYFYEGEGTGCSIYDSRPVSCRALECWNTDGIEELIEQDTISRFQIVDECEKIFTFIEEHEKSCPCPDMYTLYVESRERRFPAFGEYDELINRDIQIRNKVIEKLHISLAEELFYFGRPVFQLLEQVGGRVSEVNQGVLTLVWPTL